MTGSDCPNADPKSMRKVDFNCVSSRQLPTDVITVFLGVIDTYPLVTHEGDGIDLRFHIGLFLMV